MTGGARQWGQADAEATETVAGVGAGEGATVATLEVAVVAM